MPTKTAKKTAARKSRPKTKRGSRRTSRRKRESQVESRAEEFVGKFPFVTGATVDPFHDKCCTYAAGMSREISYGNRNGDRSLDRIRRNTIKGMRCKVASSLIRKLDPEDTVNFDFAPGVYDNYVEDGDFATDAMSVMIEEVTKDEIILSIPKNKYKTILTSIDKENYADACEFIYYDQGSDSYFHVGRCYADDIPAPEANESKFRVNLRFKVTKIKEEGLRVLKS